MSDDISLTREDDNKTMSGWDRQRRRNDQRRGTLSVSRAALKADKKHFGAAPRPVEKSERLWRPQDIRL